MGTVLCPECAYAYDKFILLRCAYAPGNASEFGIDGYGHVLKCVGEVLPLPAFGICSIVVLQLKQHLPGLNTLGGYAVVHQEFLDMVIDLLFCFLMSVFAERCKVYG